MSFPNQSRWHLKLWVAVAVAALTCAGVRMLPGAEPGNKAASPGAVAAEPAPLSPVPVPGPLAQPRSPQQLGVPLLQTMAEIPADNPPTPEKIALGMKLFFDSRLSADGTVACASCHDPDRAFTDGRPTSVGFKGRVGQRNAPTILNALYNKKQFWDGRAKTLEEQAALPITNPSEMGQPSLDAAVAKIAAIPEYQEAFQKVFGQVPNGLDLVRAIASYERTLISFNSPFDHFIAGDQNAIDAAAKRGWVLFNTKAHCNRCHAAVNMDVNYFTDFRFSQHRYRHPQASRSPADGKGRAPHRKGQSSSHRPGRNSSGLVGARPFSSHQERGRHRGL